jgi:excisionase family DNA binding protein
LNKTLSKPSLENYPEILDPKMLSEYLNIGYAKALALVKSGAIPTMKIGNHYKISKECLNDWLNQPGYRKFSL